MRDGTVPNQRDCKGKSQRGRPHPQSNLLLQKLIHLAVLSATPFAGVEFAATVLRENTRDRHGTSRTKYDYKWIVDSGATKHCCNDITKFKSIDRSKQIPIRTYGSGIIFAQGIDGL